MRKMFKLIALTLLLVMVPACGIKNENDKNNEPVSPIEEALDNETTLKQGDIELSNVKITSSGSMNTVTATVKNVGNKTKTFDAVLYMKNDSQQILGKVTEHINQLAASTTKDISVEIMGDYTSVKTFALVVENLTEK
jgi:hypothetical protein